MSRTSSPKRQLITISPDASTRDAARSMRKHGIGALVVVDSRKQPLGLVTDRDLALYVLRKCLDPEVCHVRDCMSRPPIMVPEDVSAFAAAQLMRRNLVRRLILINPAGGAIGIVTADDLIHSLSQDLRWMADTARQGFDNEAAPPQRSFSVFGHE